MNLFCGGKFPDRVFFFVRWPSGHWLRAVSSGKLLAVSAAGPPAAFFPEIKSSGFF